MLTLSGERQVLDDNYHEARNADAEGHRVGSRYGLLASGYQTGTTPILSLPHLSFSFSLFVRFFALTPPPVQLRDGTGGA
jgi:hypothetical protein